MPRKSKVEEYQATECITPKRVNFTLTLNKTLNGLKIKVDHVESFLNDYESLADIDPIQLKIRLQMLETVNEDYNKLIDQFSTVLGDPTYNDFKFNFDKFSTQFQSLLGTLRHTVNLENSENLNKVHIDNSQIKNGCYNFVPKLPEPKIQIFDGNQSNWLTFKETYIAVIHDNPQISDVVKFTYLLDKLRGDAKACIGHVILTSAGYQKAWNSLCDRFDDKRSIVDTHIKALLNLPRVTKEDNNSLNEIYNLCISHVSSLEACEFNVDKLSELLLINIALDKLNTRLKLEWEKEITQGSLPTWKQFLDFLAKQCRILKKLTDDTKRTVNPNWQSKKPIHNKFQNSEKSNQNSIPTSTFLSNHNQQNQRRLSQPNDNNPKTCVSCNSQNHWPFMCSNFLQMSTHDRFDKVKEGNICINCLKSTSHGSRSCPSRGCKICNNKHHTLLHHVDAAQESSEKRIPQPIQPPSSSNVGQNFHSQNSPFSKQVLLATAIILVRDKNGKYRECRAMLDSASSSNYVTESFASQLRLDRISCSCFVFGLNKTETQIKEKIHAFIKSRISSFQMNIDLSVVPTISDSLPQYSFDISKWNIPSKIILADPNFNISRPVDMLIGGEKFFDLLRQGQIKLKTNQPTFRETVFGWICVGANSEPHQNFLLATETEKSTENDLNHSLKKLFDLDHVPEKKFLSKEESYCETYFLQTFSRDESGRYICELPLKQNFNELGESKQQAINRFLSLERKLNLDPELKEQYTNVINDYIRQGHMKDVDISQPCEQSYFLPHHAVIKPSSTTTKVRVVFDASAKSSSGLSLNDVMCVGPIVQETSFNIALRFRNYKYVFTSDICQMYRQVKISECQTPLQRIVWRPNVSDQLQFFEINRVTFGTAAAPYLATRSLKQLSIDEEQNYPDASVITKRDFYVDDILSGSNDLNQVLKIRDQLISLLLKGGFKLHKWCSNDDCVLEGIDICDIEKLKVDDSTSDECMKTLGLLWLPKQDVFKFQGLTMTKDSFVTKRSILSDIAKLYDPFGLLAPTVILAKILVQSLWKLSLDWDDPIPDEIFESWDKFRIEIEQLKNLKIERRLSIDNPSIVQLHGFADASEKAFGACIYLRCIDHDENVSVKLICSKTRVAPIKCVSLPRLELCAAVLLSNLIKVVIDALEISLDNVYLWSDSTITLSWIQTAPYKLKTFIANRVNIIQENTVNYTWNHVESAANPADLITRGVMPSELINLEFWWQGPQFLHSNIINFDSNILHYSVQDTEHNDYELKQEIITMTSVDQSNHWIERFSSYNKLLRITSIVLRLRHRIKGTFHFQKEFISSDELKYTLNHIVKQIQATFFPTELNCLQQGKDLPRKSKILSLNPFVDSYGIIRVGGRLSNSTFNYDVKHPILLPAKCHFTTLIFRHYHQANMHAGPQLLVSLVRQRFWPVSAKNSAKLCVRSCIICFKVKPQIITQLMGELPTERTTPARPFTTTGVDLCGPFFVKNKEIRNSKPTKVYICIFVCFVVKAVHVEILSNLSSHCFIDCLKRFISRRGKPKTIWCDNATNFVGAKNTIDDWYQLFTNEDQVQQINKYCTMEEIRWKFIPPRAPNFGGLWESAVKSLKHHLKRIATNVMLTYEELLTFVVQAEGILNSRPLYLLSDDPNELAPLTPAHFLGIAGTIEYLPEPSLLEIPENRLVNWQKVSQMIQHFWKRFSVEYIHSLQQRSKWKLSNPNINVNDVVIVLDEGLLNNKWLLGIVTEVFKGSDDKIRIALIKTTKVAYLNLGTSLIALGRCQEAASILQEGSKLDGTGLRDRDAHENARIASLLQLGSLYADQGKLQRALAVYKEALHTLPERYPPQSIYHRLGDILSRLHQWTEAERFHRAALEAQPDHIAAHLSYGTMLARNSSRASEAEQWFKRAIRLAPTDSSVYHHYAEFLSTVSRHKEACEQRIRAAELSPSDYSLVVSAATALRLIDRKNESEKWYRKAVNLRPDDARAHTNLGAILHLLGRTVEAAISYKEALKLQPGDPTTLANLAKLGILEVA